MLLVQRVPQQDLDDGLTADIQIHCRLIQFFQHGQRKVYIDALNRSIILPELVKKREMSSSLSANSAISSAVGG